MTSVLNAGTFPCLWMRGVQKHFGATRALAGVDFEVNSGEVHAVVGENGAGKSTLMKVLAGVHGLDVGEMRLQGKPYRPRSPLDARRNGVVMIYQELSLAPHLSVMENILLGVEPRRGPFLRWKEMRRRAVDALEQVGLGDVAAEMPAGRLSIAQQQMVEIARGVAVDCRLLVLDEPTSSLTGDDIENLFSLIARLKSEGLAIIYISHFLDEVQRVSDRFTVLRDGQSVGGGRTADTTSEKIVAQMVGRPMEDLYPRSTRVPGAEALRLWDLAGRRGPQSASLSLHYGEIVGIAGLVGAGRTELFRTIFGLDVVRAGRMRIGAYAGPASPSRRWAQKVGFVSEDRKSEGLALGLSITDNVTLPQLRGLVQGGLVTPSGQAAACRGWIEKLALRCTSPHQRVGTLSGGNQQKVALARLLHAEVDVLLLDEPTRGIDVGAKAEIYRLLDELACGSADGSRRGRAVLLISSYLPELLGICDRIGVMYRGRLSEVRPVAAWDERRLMMVATGQES
jgi:ribose transport system ATP-binding protein